MRSLGGAGRSQMSSWQEGQERWYGREPLWAAFKLDI